MVLRQSKGHLCGLLGDFYCYYFFNAVLYGTIRREYQTCFVLL